MTELELPPVIGHRGAAGRAPENTLAGFRAAQALGCDWVEFDVRLTGDGALVVCHDPRLDRTTDSTGLIAARSLDAIRRADAGIRFGPEFAGERVPTLDEALLLAAELGLAADVEIKADRGREYATAAAVGEAFARLRGRLGQVLVSSFQPLAFPAAAQTPDIARAMLFRFVPRNWREIAERLGCIAIGADHRRLTRSRAAAIRAAGYPLAAYTVNNPARARLLFEWGVSSVFSDMPDVILRTNAGHAPALVRQGAIR